MTNDLIINRGKVPHTNPRKGSAKMKKIYRLSSKYVNYSLSSGTYNSLTMLEEALDLLSIVHNQAHYKEHRTEENSYLLPSYDVPDIDVIGSIGDVQEGKLFGLTYSQIDTRCEEIRMYINRSQALYELRHQQSKFYEKYDMLSNAFYSLKSYRKYVQEELDDLWSDDIFPALNALAPDGCYFGPHEGNSSDYGFWEVN